MTDADYFTYQGSDGYDPNAARKHEIALLEGRIAILRTAVQNGFNNFRESLNEAQAELKLLKTK